MWLLGCPGITRVKSNLKCSRIFSLFLAAFLVILKSNFVLTGTDSFVAKIVFILFMNSDGSADILYLFCLFLKVKTVRVGR